jgi:hypothetical protein
MKTEPEVFNLDPNTPWGRSLTDTECADMFRAGRLQGAPLERYWRMGEFNRPMPAYLELQMRKSDLDKLIRKLRGKKHAENSRRRGEAD